MELCDLNLERWIYQNWDEATAKKLSFLTAQLPFRARVGQVWDIMEDITRAVAFIHENHEIHHDLKPSNGLYPYKTWTKTFSFVFPRQRSMEGYRFCIHNGGLFLSSIHNCLCMGYEELSSTRTHPPKPIKIHHKVDIWTIGCILYELVLPRRAFKDDWEVLQYATSGKDFDVIIEPETVPDDGRREFISNIIRELLSIDPTRRPRAAILYKRLISWGSDISASQPDSTIAPVQPVASWVAHSVPKSTNPVEIQRYNEDLLDAAKKGNLEDVIRLLGTAADVEVKDSSQKTPLSRAAWNGHLEVVKFLVREAGADVEEGFLAKDASEPHS